MGELCREAMTASVLTWPNVTAPICLHKTMERIYGDSIRRKIERNNCLNKKLMPRRNLSLEQTTTRESYQGPNAQEFLFRYSHNQRGGNFHTSHNRISTSLSKY